MGFIQNIVDAVSENLISGDAYYLIVKSLIVTATLVLIAWGISAVLGGLVSFFMCYEKKAVSRVFEAICFIFRSSPALLLMLLFYYVFFKSSHMSTTMIAGLALGLYGAGHFAEILAHTVKLQQKRLSASINRKLERNYYSVVLPQALEDSLFDIKRLCVQLLQWTTIVGYISVNDLTELMNRIGQRTMYPFFSIFFTILCYMVATLLIEGIFSFIRKRLEAAERKEEQGEEELDTEIF